MCQQMALVVLGTFGEEAALTSGPSLTLSVRLS